MFEEICNQLADMRCWVANCLGLSICKFLHVILETWNLKVKWKPWTRTNLGNNWKQRQTLTLDLAFKVTHTSSLTMLKRNVILVLTIYSQSMHWEPSLRSLTNIPTKQTLTQQLAPTCTGTADSSCANEQIFVLNHANPSIRWGLHGQFECYLLHAGSTWNRNKQ